MGSVAIPAEMIIAELNRACSDDYDLPDSRLDVIAAAKFVLT
jgi:hypothetical protein